LSVGLLRDLPGGVHLAGAGRVLAVELPYRDFWTLYAPGSYALLAALFAVFGTRALVSAAGGLALGAATAALAQRLARQAGARLPEALAVAAIFAAALWNTDFHRAIGTYPPAIFCYALALLAVGRGGERPGPWALAGAGAALGATALFKHDVGAYAALACAATLAVQAAARGEPAAALRRIAGMGAAALAVFAPPMLWLAAQGAWPAMWHDLVVFPATTFPVTRPEAYPSLLPSGALFDLDRPKRVLLYDAARWAIFAAPTLVAIPAIARLLWASAGLPPEEVARGRARAVRFGVALLLHWRAAQVQINTHVVSITLFAALLGAAALGTLPPRSRLRAAGLVVAALWHGAQLEQPAAVLRLHRDDPREPIPLRRARAFLAHPEDAARYAQLEAIVDRHVPEDGTLFVGERRHDAVVVSDSRLYFLLERRPATRFHELHPGVADTAPVQREIVSDLEAHETPLVILRHTFEDEPLDAFRERLRASLPDAGTGATVLDRYLATRYETLDRLDRLEVRTRREEPLPAEPAP
ncbi:MAG: hypothetical protein R3263_09520, partial [Myxococcota bacterium]|nr:hypothetical protein [Myxococcota bacterium]